jgi:hypothetical protein
LVADSDRKKEKNVNKSLDLLKGRDKIFALLRIPNHRAADSILEGKRARGKSL